MSQPPATLVSMGLTLWRGGDGEAGPPTSGDRSEQSPSGFAPSVALGLAELTEADLAEGSLVLALSVSTWIRRSGITLGSARTIMFSLRRALLTSSELDGASEPIPLMAGDPVAAVLGLARYLWEMIDRATRGSGATRWQVAAAAVEELDVADAAQTG